MTVRVSADDDQAKEQRIGTAEVGFSLAPFSQPVRVNCVLDTVAASL